MPRKRRTRVSTVPSVAQVSQSAGNSEDEERSVRTQVFEKTKMCKFHILGACAKGSSCRFAHFPSELNNLPDLACTKLCKALIATGLCDNPDCRYAHSQEELRPMPFGQTEREKDKRCTPLGAGALVHPVGQVTTRSAAPSPVHLQAKLPTQESRDFSRWESLSQEDVAPSRIGGLLQAEATRMPKVASAAARLCSLGQEEDQPSEALRMLSATEPVQINLHSLRSLSGNNLVAMAEDSEDWAPPRVHTRHTSLELRDRSLANPMMIPSVASGLGPIVPKTEEKMPTTVEQFWQRREAEFCGALSDYDYTSKLDPSQWMDQTYLGDTGYSSWSKGFEHLDVFPDSGLCTVGSQ